MGRCAADACGDWLSPATPGPPWPSPCSPRCSPGRPGTPLARGLLVTAAVLAGQLSIGWSNDLIDARRDRAVGRTDKPLAVGRRYRAGRAGRVRCRARRVRRASRSPAAGRRASSTCCSVSLGLGLQPLVQAHRALPAAVCRGLRRAAGRRHARPPVARLAAGVGDRDGRAARGRRPPAQRPARPRRRRGDRGAGLPHRLGRARRPVAGTRGAARGVGRGGIRPRSGRHGAGTARARASPSRSSPSWRAGGCRSSRPCSSRWRTSSASSRGADGGRSALSRSG